MDEDSARAVTLLQAFETTQPPSSSWSDDDRAWATRLALQDNTVDAEAFIARRAHHAMQRLGAREPAAAKWLAQRLWRGRWVGWAVLAGLIAGGLADSIGSSQRINLLAPPLWAVLAWNAVVYLLLLGHALARLLARSTRPGSGVRAMQRVLQFGRRLPGASTAGASAGSSARASDGSSARALQAFASAWLRASAPLSAARASTLLHAAAAALAAGLIAGLYLRGLVFDYRAAWESTFLSADAARTALAIVLAPAAALSGIAVPDAAGFEALREVHGSSTASASAAPWIHLFALTLVLFVVLPRSVLALVDALRARWLAGRVALPAGDAYLERLARQQSGDVAHVVVLPYASTPTAQAALGLRALLVPALGDPALRDGLQLRIADTAAFGAEDEAEAGVALDAGTTLVVALFDLSATPEAENQGRFARQLAARAPAGAATVLLVDEAGFKQRFGADSARLVQRREAWRVFAEALGTVPVCTDLGTPGSALAARALGQAMRSPVTRSAA